MSKKATKAIVKFLNGAIDRKKSTLLSFKASRNNFRKAIDNLPKGDRRKKGGNALSKSLFVNNFRFNGSSSTMKSLVADGMERDLKAGAKSLRKLKKERKNLASGRVRFIRRNGRIIPIKK